MDSPLGQQSTLSSPSMVRHWEQILVVSEIVFNDICPLRFPLYQLARLLSLSFFHLIIQYRRNDLFLKLLLMAVAEFSCKKLLPVIFIINFLIVDCGRESVEFRNEGRKIENIRIYISYEILTYLVIIKKKIIIVIFDFNDNKIENI